MSENEITNHEYGCSCMMKMHNFLVYYIGTVFIYLIYFFSSKNFRRQYSEKDELLFSVIIPIRKLLCGQKIIKLFNSTYDTWRNSNFNILYYKHKRLTVRFVTWGNNTNLPNVT